MNKEQLAAELNELRAQRDVLNAELERRVDEHQAKVKPLARRIAELERTLLRGTMRDK